MPDQNFLLPGEQFIFGVENGLGAEGCYDLPAQAIGAVFEGRWTIGFDPAGQASS